MSDTPTYLEGNKVEAERCVELANEAWRSGDLSRAHRLLGKSLKLYPTTQAKELIERISSSSSSSSSQNESNQQSEAEARREREAEQMRAQREREAAAARQRAAAQQQQSSSTSSSTNRVPSSNSTSSPSPSSSPNGANYTGDQSAAARAILALKNDYYALFSVSRTASEQEIKSSYRKLALKFHPDKNKAPEAEEAFKLIGTAFQCLSDKEKRRHYDLYGEDDSSSRARQQAAASQQYHREEDLSPEEIFNMFFNGGMPTAGPRRTFTYRRYPAGSRQFYSNNNTGAEQPSPLQIFQQFAHFIPLFLILFFYLFAASPHDEPHFSLQRTNSFPIHRVTSHAKIDYWVSNQFQYQYQRDYRALQRIESLVESEVFKRTEEECGRQKRALNDEERRVKRDARGAELAAKLQALHNRPLEACEKLHKYQMSAHGASKGG